MSLRTTPINSTRTTQLMRRDVHLEDGTILELTLVPGQLAGDVLWDMGYREVEYVEVAAGFCTVRH